MQQVITGNVAIDHAFNRGRDVQQGRARRASAFEKPRTVISEEAFAPTSSVARYKRVSAAKSESKGVKRFKMSLLFFFFVLLIMALLYSNAELTEQQGELEKLDDELVQLTGEFEYLSFEVESKASLNKVEEFATRELGLVKGDSSKIEYIDLNSENKLVVNDEPLTQWQKMLTQNFLSIVEYLNP